MKWVNHQAVTGVLAYAVSSDLLFTAGAIYGSIIPDKIEGKADKRNYKSWRRRHRGLSHWALLYITVFLVILQIFNVENISNLLSSENNPLKLIAALFFGAICHIAEDAICGKVPTVTPNIKWGVRLFKVGSFAEYAVAIFLIIIIYLFKTHI